MPRYRLTRRAEADIGAIEGWIARDSPVRATTFVQELRQLCADIPRFPDAGEARDDLGLGVPRRRHGRYLIFYRSRPDGLVVILRVLHGARDILRLLD